MEALLTPFFGRPVSVHNDALLLGGALLSENIQCGVAVIAGTGSVVIGLEVDADGNVQQTARRGGHGYLLGDDGSAYDIGRCAIRCAVNDYDDGKEVEGGVAAKLREHFGCQETGELLAQVHTLDPTLSPVDATNKQKLRISSASRFVMEAFTSSSPDPLAVRAVEDAVLPLATSVVALMKHLLRLAEQDGSSAKYKNTMLIAGGGVVRQEPYRRLLEKTIRDIGGITFSQWQLVGDVGGTAVMGLVDKAARDAKH